MADEVTHHVKTHFTVEDHATKPLQGIASAANHVSGIFDHASHIVGMFGTAAGVAGAAFSAHEVISGTLSFMENVKQIQAYTGETANNAGGLLSALKGGGIEAEEAANAIRRMSMAGERSEMAMMRMHGVIGSNVGIFQRMGIDITKGPLPAMLQMSRLAQKNQLSVTQVGLAFRVQGKTAQHLVEILRKGPQALQEQLAEFKKLGITSKENMETYENIREHQHHIRELWERIQLIVGVKLLPVIEKLLEKVETQLGGWVEHAQKFGSILGKFLDQHLKTVLKIAKIMAMNFALMKATGTGMGGWAAKLIQKVGPLSLGGGALAGAAKAAPATGLAGALPILSKLGSVISSMGNLAGSLVSMLPVIAAIVGMVAVVVTAWDLISNNVDNIRGWFSELWVTMQARFGVIIDMLGPVMSTASTVGHYFKEVVFVGLMALGEVFDGMMHVVQTIIYMFTHLRETFASPGGALRAWEATAKMTVEKQRQMGIQQAQEAIKETRRRKMEKTAPDLRETPPHFDFRGSRFNITQKFAEGFDPDRISVAFTNDLAMLGERRTMSQHAPAFSGT